MSKLEELSSAIQTVKDDLHVLTLDVDAAVTKLNTPSPTDQQLDSIIADVSNIGATLQAQGQRLADAVNPPVEEPPPAEEPAPTDEEPPPAEQPVS